MSDKSNTTIPEDWIEASKTIDPNEPDWSSPEYSKDTPAEETDQMKIEYTPVEGNENFTHIITVTPSRDNPTFEFSI